MENNSLELQRRQKRLGIPTTMLLLLAKEHICWNKPKRIYSKYSQLRFASHSKVSVGNLPPGKEVTIRISYITELEVSTSDQSITFRLPTTVTPRYAPASMEGRSSTTMESSNDAGYSMLLEVTLDMPSKIASVECNFKSARVTTKGKGGRV